MGVLYLAEGVVRGMTDARPSASLGWLEALRALAFFGFALAYVAPFKRAARLNTLSFSEADSFAFSTPAPPDRDAF